MTGNSMPGDGAETVVRPVAERDLPAVFDLHDSWALERRSNPQELGFLLTPARREFLSERLLSRRWSGIVLKKNGALQGYLLTSRDIPEAEKLDWICTPSDLTQDSGHLHVMEIAVSFDSLRHGVGRTLYAELAGTPGCSSLSAFVASAPLANHASEKFHRNQGFEEAARFKRHEFMGLLDYSSILFAKRISPSRNLTQSFQQEGPSTQEKNNPDNARNPPLT